MPDEAGDEPRVAVECGSDAEEIREDRPLLTERHRAVLLGVSYVLFVGWFELPYGLQATLFVVLLLAAFTPTAQSGLLRARDGRLLYAAVGFAALFFLITTNALIVTLLWLLVVFGFSLHLLMSSGTRELPESGVAYLGGLRELSALYLVRLLSFRTVRGLFSWRVREARAVRIDFDGLSGVLLALPVLSIFHLLFAAINSEYAAFVDAVFAQLWRILQYINVQMLLEMAAASYLFYAALILCLPEKGETGERNTFRYRLAKQVLCPTIVLFLVFSFFQGKLLRINPYQMEFKALSLYVQCGFWELLFVALFGYLITTMIQKRTKVDAESEKQRLRLLLTVFLCELLLITVFAQHKLAVHQLIFGLKDTRIAASFAVLLIAISFVLQLFILSGRVGETQLFRAQYACLAFVVLGFAAVNLDQTITDYYPIRYNFGGKPVKDYSYLLTNSFDNYASWPELMEEGMEQGIPFVKDYYWGSYSWICSGATRPFHKQLEVLARYDRERRSIREQLRFNVREYRAHQLLKDNRQLVERFVSFIENGCK